MWTIKLTLNNCYQKVNGQRTLDQSWIGSTYATNLDHQFDQRPSTLNLSYLTHLFDSKNSQLSLKRILIFKLFSIRWMKVFLYDSNKDVAKWQYFIFRLKDTPIICKNWLKSKVSVYGEYFHTRTIRVVHLFSSVRPAFKVRLKLRFEHDSCMWRHQF